VADEAETQNATYIAGISGEVLEEVNAMLLNEFLKEHEKVQKLEAALAAVSERLKAQDAKIDKVNATLEVTNVSPRIVNNNQ